MWVTNNSRMSQKDQKILVVLIHQREIEFYLLSLKSFLILGIFKKDNYRTFTLTNNIYSLIHNSILLAPNISKTTTTPLTQGIKIIFYSPHFYMCTRCITLPTAPADILCRCENTDIQTHVVVSTSISSSSSYTTISPLYIDTYALIRTQSIWWQLFSPQHHYQTLNTKL